MQKTLAASAVGDAFVGEIKPAGAGAADLIYLSYFGGSGATGQSPDEGFAVALGTLPTVYIAGQTSSANFPATVGAFQTTLKGASDAFAAKLTLQSGLTISDTSLTFTSSAIGTPTAAQSVTLTNNSNVAITFTSATITNPTPASGRHRLHSHHYLRSLHRFRRHVHCDCYLHPLRHHRDRHPHPHRW